MKKLRRNLSTPESREFWAAVSAAAEAVRGWPAWKRGEWQENPATKPYEAPDPQGGQVICPVCEMICSDYFDCSECVECGGVWGRAATPEEAKYSLQAPLASDWPVAWDLRMEDYENLVKERK